MKFKRIIGLVLGLGILFSLCSCAYLDELKEKYAYYFENENGIKCISYNESTYIPYDIENFIHINAGIEINVTYNSIDMKVPVLLSGIDYFRANFYATDGYEMLKKPDISSHHMYYIREDCYDEYDRIIKNKELYYCNVSSVTFTEEKITRLSDELTSVIDGILAKNEPVDISEDHHYTHLTNIQMCDEKARFYLPYAAYLQIWEYDGRCGIGTVTVEEDGNNRFLFYEIPQDKLWLFRSEIDKIG